MNVLSQEKPGPRENNGVVLSDSRSQSIYLFGGVSAKKERKKEKGFGRIVDSLHWIGNSLL